MFFATLLSRVAAMSCARRFVVAKPTFSGRRSVTTVLSQDCQRWLYSKKSKESYFLLMDQPFRILGKYYSILKTSALMIITLN